MPRSDLWPAKHAQDQHFVDRISARAADARAQRQEDTLKELDGAEDEVAPVGAQCRQEEALKALDGAEDGVEMRHVSFQPDALEEAAVDDTMRSRRPLEAIDDRIREDVAVETRKARVEAIDDTSVGDAQMKAGPSGPPPMLGPSGSAIAIPKAPPAAPPGPPAILGPSGSAIPKAPPAAMTFHDQESSRAAARSGSTVGSSTGRGAMQGYEDRVRADEFRNLRGDAIVERVARQHIFLFLGHTLGISRYEFILGRTSLQEWRRATRAAAIARDCLQHDGTYRV